MFFLAILLLHMLGQALGQSACGSPTLTDAFTPIVMRYTPFMTPQVAPISTIYETIMTTWFNAVDCRYVTPLRVDENPAAEGPFTTYVRSSVLTVTRVGCMPETTAVTRRDVRGQEQLQLRSVSVEHNQQIRKRRTTQDAINEVITNTVAEFPPNPEGLTLQEYRYLVSVNTAIFAINLVQAGIDLNYTCRHLRDPVFQATLFRTTIDPVQAGDIVCFAESNGLYFSQGIDKVVTYLESLVYALQVRSDYPEDSEDFCWPLITEDSPFLGIDTEGIAQYLCPVNAPVFESTTTNTRESTVSTRTIGHSTGTVAPPPTGGPFANITVAGPSSTAGYGTGFAPGTGSPTWAPFTNSSSIDSGNVSATVNSNATITGTGPASGSATVTSSPATAGNATTTELVTTTDSANFTGTATATNNTTASETATSAAFTTNNVGTIGTQNTVGAFSTDIIFPNATYTSTNSDATAVTGSAFSTGNLPQAPTSVSPGIEPASSALLRRPRRW